MTPLDFAHALLHRLGLPQAHGPQHSLRRLQWIEPYWKGSEDATIKARAVNFFSPARGPAL